MSAEAEVREATAALVAAFGSHDTDAYFDQLAPDAVLVFHTSPERLRSRDDYRALWARWEAEDGFRVLSCASSDVGVQVLADDVAVVAHEVATRVRTNDGEEDVAERETIVWQRRDGRWLVVHEHLSAPS